MKLLLSTAIAIGALHLHAQTTCPEFNPTVQAGRVANTALTEISGIAASRQSPGVIWAHDDSGDVNRLFALNTAGTHLGTIYLTGAIATDWEDMAIGPGPIAGQDYLYVSDTGNNTLSRSVVTIYRVPEPSLAGLPLGGQVDLGGVEALPIQYPDGNRDVETLLVDPLSGDIILLTRDRSLTGWTHVYLYPVELQAPGELRTVQYVTSLASSVEIKGGDVSPSGLSVLLRRHASTNAPGWLFNRTPGEPIESVFSTVPCLVPFVLEPQGEAVTFAADMSGYYTISEGATQPIYFYPFLTSPPAPNNGSGSATSTTQASLQWQDNANSEAGFTIERSIDGVNFDAPAFLPANTTGVTDSGLLPATTYWYRVAAFNNAGTSAPLLISLTTLESMPTIPAAPSGLTAVAVSKTQINMRWTDNASDEQGFKIERSNDNRSWTQIATVGSDVTAFSGTGLQANKRYYFRVRAFNAAGNSAYSITASATTQRK